MNTRVFDSWPLQLQAVIETIDAMLRDEGASPSERA
jgi:hypothetical protein